MLNFKEKWLIFIYDYKLQQTYFLLSLSIEEFFLFCFFVFDLIEESVHQFKHQSNTTKTSFSAILAFSGRIKSKTGKKGLSGLVRHLNCMTFNAICTKPSTALHDLIHIHTYHPTHTAMPTYYLVQEVNNQNRSNIRLQSNITQLLLSPSSP